jgi:hypothetical protein
MSVKMMSAVFERFPYGGNERVLALALADNANEYGEHIYPGNETLAKKCLISERTIIRMVQKFIDIGWLIKVKQGNKRCGQANEYRISEHWVLGGDLDLLGDKLSPNNQVTNTPLLGDKSASLGDKSELLGDIAVSPQRHIQHHNNVITTPCAREPIAETELLTAAQSLVRRLNSQNVQATSFNPYLLAWMQEGLSDSFIDDCVERAKLQKPTPEKIPMSYLESVIRGEIAKNLRPKKPDRSWRTYGNNAGIDAMAREHKITCPRNITDYQQFADYLEKIIAERQRNGSKAVAA